MNDMHWRASRLVLILLGFVFAACGGGDSAEQSTTQPGESTPALRVTDVSVGSSINADRSVRSPMSSFAPTDTIYASVATEGTGSGSLTARWQFEDGQVVDETTQSISPSGTGHTEFHISMPDGFPSGAYTVEILVNGQRAATESYAVR